MLQKKFQTRFVRDATQKNVSAFSLVGNGPQKTVNKILNIDLSQWQSEPSILFYTRAQFLSLSRSLFTQFRALSFAHATLSKEVAAAALCRWDSMHCNWNVRIAL